MTKISTYFERHKDKGVSFDKPSRTKQEFSEESDVNHLVDRYIKTGSWGEASAPRMPHYGEFTDEMDFREMQNLILDARNDFDKLPAKIRDKFSNDVAELIDFLDDPKNHIEARDLGILPVIDPPFSAPPEASSESPKTEQSEESDQPTT